MSFLGLFKSKREKTLNKFYEKTFNDVFPNGKEQARREINEVNNLLGDKYSKDQVKDLYFHIAFLFSISDDKSEERIVESTLIKTNHKVKEEDIIKIYNYVKNKFLKQKLGIEDQAVLDEFSSGLFGGNEGCATDEIPKGFGEFGLSETNPIPIKGIAGNETYLRRLRIENDDSELKWERIGTCSSDNIEHVIDKYQLFNSSGNKVAVIYISPYHKKISNKAPRGFELS